MSERGETGVLDNDGIGTAFGAPAEFFGCIGEFIGKNQDIEGDEPLDSVVVEEVQNLGEFFARKVFGAHSGIEFGEPEIDGIGTIGDSGAESLPVAGGSD